MADTSPLDWLQALHAEPEGDTPVTWGRWEVGVPTYRAPFAAIHPKRTRDEQKAVWQDEYGKTLLASRDGSRSVPELEVVKAFRAAGWGARWTDAFGAAPAWMAEWKRGSPPADVTRLLAAIKAESPQGKPWDVLAWRDGMTMFVECKAGEGWTDAQRAFIWGAVRLGVAVDRFAVVEAVFAYPARETPAIGRAGSPEWSDPQGRR